jgi:uncharacterized membrane protein
MMFGKLVRIDRVLIWLNLLYLLLVAFFPIPTAVLGQWIASSRESQLIAVLFYGAASTALGFMFNVLWWHAAYWGKLTSPRLTTAGRRATTIAWAPAPLFIAGVAALGFLDPRIAFAGFLAVGIAYVLPMHRIVARARR